MQEIIAKIEKIIFDFKKQNENKLELHHVDVLNSFSKNAKIDVYYKNARQKMRKLTSIKRI